MAWNEGEKIMKEFVFFGGLSFNNTKPKIFYTFDITVLLEKYKSTKNTQKINNHSVQFLLAPSKQH